MKKPTLPSSPKPEGLTLSLVIGVTMDIKKNIVGVGAYPYGRPQGGRNRALPLPQIVI
jgi:hypothetical protein